MKKLTSLLLTFAMLFSLAMPAMAAEGDTATVYFQNNWMWTDVCAYIHYTDGTENAASPGLAMEFEHNDGNYDIYSVTFPVSNIDYIIFSGIKDDGSGARDATPQIPSSDLYRNATYYCAWNDGNTYGRTGGEGESLDSTAAPSGPSISGNTSGNVTATYTPSGTTEPTIEAMWGTSKDDLSNSGTLAEAFAAAAADSSIAYIQLQTSVTTDDGYTINSGVFTLDLNGNTLSSLYDTLDVGNSGTEVTLTDTATGGAVTSTKDGYAAVSATEGGKVVIDNGSYSGFYAVFVYDGAIAEIKDGTFSSTIACPVYAAASSTVTIDNGTFSGGYTSIRTRGTTTINGGNFTGSDEYGAIAYYGGTLDLSGYNAVNGLTLSQGTGADLTVSDENIKLPTGYVFKDSEGNTVDTLVSETVYTIGAEGGSEPTAKITGVTVTGGYSIEDGVVTVVEGGDSITVTVTGENFAALTESHEVGVARYESLTSANGWTIDTENNTAVKIFAPADLTTGVAVTYMNPGDTTGIRSGYNIYVLKPGTTLETIYFNTGGNSAWTDVAANFVDSSSFGLVENSMTMKETNIYATQGEIPDLAYYVTFTNGTDSTMRVQIPTDGSNMYNLADGTWSYYDPSQPPADVTSAEITWGSMAFTYSDEQVTLEDGSTTEKGWTNDGSEGAGTVTVKNTGDTTIMASASYVPAGDFGITGSLDAAKTLASSESGTFTLTLSGKPNKALNNEKIGTVTIEITEVAPTVVTTADELVSALAAGGSIKLGGEITLEERVLIEKPVTLDLNTHTLTLQTNGYIIVWQSDLSVRNGTILSGTRAVIECQFGSTLTVDNCTLSSPDYFALYLYDTTAVVTNSTLIGGVAVDSAYSTSTLTAVDRVTMTSIEGAGASGLSVKTGCTATVGFDPTDILTDYYNQGTVTNNGDGTWTVQ